MNASSQNLYIAMKIFDIYIFSYIFWTDSGRVPKIEKARLDGSERTVLAKSNLLWPSGIAIDIPNQRLYWADPKASVIETMNLDGTDRQIVAKFSACKLNKCKL